MGKRLSAAVAAFRRPDVVTRLAAGLHGSPLFSAPCLVNPDDVLTVADLSSAGIESEDGAPNSPVLGIGISNAADGAGLSVILTPNEGRRVAAAILNAADKADGLTPLLFVPSQPTPPKGPEGAGV